MIESMSRFSEYFKEGITKQETQCPEWSPEYDASLFIIYTYSLLRSGQAYSLHSRGCRLCLSTYQKRIIYTMTLRIYRQRKNVGWEGGGSCNRTVFKLKHLIEFSSM